MKDETGSPSGEGKSPKRFRFELEGTIQGVGFRPFVYRLARELDLAGWVVNTPRGVTAEAEGAPDRLDAFRRRLSDEKPPHAVIHAIRVSEREPGGAAGFEIRASESAGPIAAFMLPDIATCGDCLREVFDPSDRRYLYPFTNCTHCGPRFSIIRALPYDRPNTSMKDFEMCPACRREYEDPMDRRFHAQPNACPGCGPRLAFWTPAGAETASEREAPLLAAEAIREGRIVAAKGLGGFHLMADARNGGAVRELRRRKHREEKPLALMVPSIAAARELCELSPDEAALLASPQAPIVLLKRLGPDAGGLAAGIAPGNPRLGVMLPCTPMHHILMRELGFPIVATSGNLSDEPICIDEREALQRLAGIADGFLVHNRPIVRHVDDSVARWILGRTLILRRSRGYAPAPVTVDADLPPAIAVGGHLKNTLAVTRGNAIFVSQHIGDLETLEANRAFEEAAGALQAVYRIKPAFAVCDLHPDYRSTRFAEQTGAPVIRIQHHHAHVLSCLLDNGAEGPVLGVSWDGTGYGTDGTVWGGEFLVSDFHGFERAGHLRPFPLPGGERAVKTIRLAAIGLLHSLFGDAMWEWTDLPPLAGFPDREREMARLMLEKPFNRPMTTSAGRLFDAVASIAGIRQTANFEGQGAMELEWRMEGLETREAYPFGIEETGGARIVNFEPAIEALIEDVRRQTPVSLVSARFHNMLVESILIMAELRGIRRVALTGGCFQNGYLLEQCVTRLRTAGFEPLWHERVPPNDGGLSLGQAAALLGRTPAGG